MTGQNLSLKLEVVDENILKEVHANRSINWATPNKRYAPTDRHIDRET